MMFGDLMGNMEEKQKEMQEKLRTVQLEEKLEGISITANAAKEILNVSIDPKFKETTDLEELEDLMVVAMNKILQKIADVEAAESQSMISQMLPPGMGNLFG